jgi:F-type H+-transporting ATPase subunit gamma
MSQLIHMRQRIKTVETIKRITNAMRLISRSSHFHLNKQRKALNGYHQGIMNLFFRIRRSYPTWHSSLIKAPTRSSKTLVIVIGSQKGLCGNFNSSLFTFFQTYVRKNQLAHATMISVGKKAHDFIQTEFPGHETMTFVEHTAATIISIAQTLTETIIAAPAPYTSVLIISNKLKNFFIHYSYITTLLPFGSTSPSAGQTQEECIIEGNPYDILDQLARLYIQATLQTVLFESLLAEQAARFISMDNATRNADTILENTRLDYNKLRQAKITKDMIEISSSY